MEQIEDEKIEKFQRNDSDILQLEMFNVLARREFAVYNEFFYKKC